MDELEKDYIARVPGGMRLVGEDIELKGRKAEVHYVDIEDTIEVESSAQDERDPGECGDQEPSGVARLLRILEDAAPLLHDASLERHEPERHSLRTSSSMSSAIQRMLLA